MNFEEYYIDKSLQTIEDTRFKMLGIYHSGYIRYKIALKQAFSSYYHVSLGGKWFCNGHGAYKQISNLEIVLNYTQKTKDDEVLFFDTNENEEVVGFFKRDDNSYFNKLEYPKIVICKDASAYPDALIVNNKYYAIEEKLDLYRVIGENKKIRWYPKDCFKAL